MRHLHGQSINVRRLDVGMPVATEIPPVPVVGEDEDEAGPGNIHRKTKTAQQETVR